MGGRGSGGARAHSGPAPDLTALRRERDWKGWTRLPAKGLTLRDVPPWPEEMPLTDADEKHTKAEIAMWRRLWQMPQARVWKADGSIDLVALYVRGYLEAAEPGASAGARTWVKQTAASLLLTTDALYSAKYVIVDELATPTAGLAGHGRGPSVATAADVVGGIGLTVVPPLEDADEDAVPTGSDDD